MKKFQKIFTLIIIFILIACISFTVYKYIKNKNINNSDINNVDIYINDDIKYIDNNDKPKYIYDIDKIDLQYSILINGKEKKKYTNIESSYIVEDEYKEAFETNSVYLDIVDKSTLQNTVVTILPLTDMLGNYNIVKSNDNYSVFSYFSSGKGEEIYRCYLEEGKIVYIKNIEENKIYEKNSYPYLTVETFLNIENCFKYYIDYVANK